MLWNVSISLVWLCIVFTIIVAVLSYRKKSTGITKPINVIFSGIVLAALLGIFPTNYIANGLSSNDVTKFIEALSLSFVNVMQMFTVDLCGKDLLDIINNQETFCFQQSYVFTMSILCTIAPLLTVGALVSALVSLSAGRRYLFSFFKSAYVFSDLNECSITLASDLKANHPKSVIIFTDIVDREDETFLELSNKAKEISAIMFKQNIVTPKFHWHNKKAEISFFIMGDNETENINHSLTIIDKFKHRCNTRLFLFSSTKESELALTKVEKGKVKVCRVNEVQSLIYHMLYEKGEKLFQNAFNKDGVKCINAIVLGMGNYGMEMIKALSWFCQMDGYKLSVNAFDKDENAKSKFRAVCPDLISPIYNGVSKKGESDYTIAIHSKFDVNTSELMSAFETLSSDTPATFIFISIGSDEENVKVAANMRMLWKRLGFSPIIQTVVKDKKISEVLANAVDIKLRPYDIDYIGDVHLEYSERVIVDSELELTALQRHLKWGEEDTFWRFEYNYKSSVASVIHKRARDICRVFGSDTLVSQGVDALSDDERDSLQCLEHRRWNAYMRAEGYIYGTVRDDIARTHPDLKSYDELSESEKKKDIW